MPKSPTEATSQTPPRVSVVLPNYNYARYLDERIQSLLDQAYCDFELIIVDDASRDDSRDVIEKYSGDARVRTHFYEHNSGHAYKRWMDGAVMARGEYLLFAGADDSCDARLLEKLVAPLEANSNAVLAYCQSWQINRDGERVKCLRSWTDSLDTERWKHDFIAPGHEELPYLLTKNIIPNASAVLMRRAAFFQAGGFDMSLRLLADWLLWAKLLQLGDVAFIAEPLNYFRFHQNTVRSRIDATAPIVLERYRVAEYILRHTKPDASAREYALNDLTQLWVEAVVPRPYAAQRRFNRALHGIARRIDSRVNVRLARQTGAFIGRKLGARRELLAHRLRGS